MSGERPRLAKKARLRWDEHENTYFLLWPERGFRLNETAAAILLLCDGERTEEQIATELATRYQDAPAHELAESIAALLLDLRRQALVVSS